MGRSFPKKARNTQKRKRKPVMVVTAEGKTLQSLSICFHFDRSMGSIRYTFIK